MIMTEVGMIKQQENKFHTCWLTSTYIHMNWFSTRIELVHFCQGLESLQVVSASPKFFSAKSLLRRDLERGVRCMQQASDLFYTMAVWVLKQKSTSKSLSSLKLTYPNLEKGKSHPGGYFFSFRTLALCFFSAKFPKTIISSGSALCRKGITGRFCTSRYGAGQRLCGEPRHGKGWVWPLTLDIASQWCLETKHGYKSVVRMVPFEMLKEVAVKKRVGWNKKVGLVGGHDVATNKRSRSLGLGDSLEHMEDARWSGC